MTNRAVVDWRVPLREWAMHERTIQKEYGNTDGSTGRVTEEAMKEYAEVDRYAGVEDRVDQLLDGGGHASGDVRTKKKDSQMRRVTARVHPDVKVAFKETVDEDDRFSSYGEALAHAVSVYAQGGRAARLKDKLGRIIDSVGDAVLGASTDSEGTEADTEDAAEVEAAPEYGHGIDELNARSDVKERYATVCESLEGLSEVHEKRFTAAIKEAGITSDPQIRKYKGEIADLLGFEQHPSTTALWVPEERVDEIVGEGAPAVCRKPISELSRRERARRIRIEAGARAMRKNDPTHKIKGHVVTSEILNDEVGQRAAQALVKEACEAHGFSQHPDRDSGATIRVNTKKISEHLDGLAEDIRRYLSDEIDPSEPEEVDEEAEAEERMSQLMQGAPATGD